MIEVEGGKGTGGQGLPSLDRLEIRYARTVEEAEAGRDHGFEPIECSFGLRSVVGPLQLDHHGSLAGEEPVSLKAAKIMLQNGGGERSPLQGLSQIARRFQFAGMPDPDSVYAALVLSGVITPSLEIGRAIGELDLDPIGVDRTTEPYVRNPAFEMHGVPSLSLEGFKKALEVGARVFDAEPLPQSLRDKALDYERKRIEAARRSVVRMDGATLFAVSDDPSRDVWHRRAPVVVQYKPTLGVITLSGCTRLGAQRLGTSSVFDRFGDEGLKPLYKILDETLGAAESGGRPDIGGSPRGLSVSGNDAARVYDAIRAVV